MSVKIASAVIEKESRKHRTQGVPNVTRNWSWRERGTTKCFRAFVGIVKNSRLLRNGERLKRGIWISEKSAPTYNTKMTVDWLIRRWQMRWLSLISENIKTPMGVFLFRAEETVYKEEIINNYE